MRFVSLPRGEDDAISSPSPRVGGTTPRFPMPVMTSDRPSPPGKNLKEKKPEQAFFNVSSEFR
jgi:hypothetical protein